MTAATDQMKRALHEIRRLRGALDQATRDRAERGAIAIVGTGLRLPGGISSLPQLEEALRDGRNLVTPVPHARWNGGDLPGDMSSAAGYGAFIEDVDLFDPEFFGISGAEAASMDPQQRLLLETGWEALEDAGHAPDSFAERALGIFIGMANSDYGRMMLSDIPAIDPYFTSGSSFSVAAGRLSYFLGTTGPAITVDTACSSSLVALHLARRALVAGECDVALAGGVNLMLSPEVHVNFDRAGMLAGDGRCKTFDAAADGYVRGEGCVVLALRRLEDAQADGDRILAVIRGSAVNQDGRSNGLTAPNGRAQEVLIRAALEDAGLTPGDVGYVEAHGTGTSLGDPIEMEALGRAYARDRADAPPLAVGSVKTNLGHLEIRGGGGGRAQDAGRAALGPDSGASELRYAQPVYRLAEPAGPHPDRNGGLARWNRSLCRGQFLWLQRYQCPPDPRPGTRGPARDDAGPAVAPVHDVGQKRRGPAGAGQQHGRGGGGERGGHRRHLPHRQCGPGADALPSVRRRA